VIYMKKTVVFIAVGVVLVTAALLLIFLRRPNGASTVETNVKVLGDDGIYHNIDNSDVRTGSEVFLNMENENKISELLSELDWVSTALISISLYDSTVSGVLDITRTPSQAETDQAIEIITSNLDGIKKEDIIITDKNNNVIYPVSE